MKSETKRTGATQQKIILSALKRAVDSGQTPLFHEPQISDNNVGSINIPFTFIDLFAGIGGFRFALNGLGGDCLFTCEWDKYAQKTYREWFGDQEIAGDIRDINPADIPDHDIMAAGFPCQPFSIAGVSKRTSLGRAHGFKDQTQGTLFFQLATIVQIKRPPILLLENVKNLLSHDNKRTWNVIESTLDKELNYKVFKKVIDAADYVPQHRERVFIVCFDREVFGDSIPFEFPTPPSSDKPILKNILDKRVSGKYTLSDKLWKYLQDYAASHRAKGNGFGYGLADRNGISRTLSARYFKDGSEILIPQLNGKNPRRLTPKEAARLMGFTDFSDKIEVSDTQAYRQFGNAVVPAVVSAVGKQILNVILWHVLKNGSIIKR